MIEVGSDYKIDADKFQYILLKRTTGKDKDGNEKEHWHKTFHPTIHQCCNAIADDRLRLAITRNILNQYERLMNELTQAVLTNDQEKGE